MQRRSPFSHAPVLTALLVAVPGVAQAQAVSPTKDLQAPKQIRVAVDYVDVAPAAYLKAARQIPPGQNHDALLLAALVKGGAQDSPAPRVQTADDVAAAIDFVTQTPTATDGPRSPLPLHNSLEAKPHLNPDGTITVTLKTRRDALTPGVTPPTATASRFSTTRTFQRGQTLCLAGLLRAAKTAPMAYLIFAKVEAVSPP